MAHIGKKNSVYPEMFPFLDGIWITESERKLAKAHMESAERFADLVCGVMSGVQSLIAEFGRGLSGVVHHPKAVSGKPAHR